MAYVYKGSGQLVRRGLPVPISPIYIRLLHSTSAVSNQPTDDIGQLFTSKRQHKRKVYARISSIVKKELESNFQLKNRTKLRLLDDKTQGLKLKYNPKIEGDFTDFGIGKTQASLVLKNFNHMEEPTASQRRILSVLNSRLSAVCRHAPGTGNSFAIMLYTLNFKRPDKDYITSLVLVPTTSQVKQYASRFETALNGYPYDKRQMVQCIYRAAPEIEAQQEADLTAVVPHILVATPQRLLDIISAHSDDSHFTKLERVRFIACDEADTLLLDEEKYVKRDYKHTKPAFLLISWLNKLRATVVNNVPLQFCFITSIDLSNRVIKLVQEQNWTAERPLVPMGLSAIKNHEVVPRLRIPNNIDVGAVVVDKTGALFDVKMNELPIGIDAMQKIRSEVAKEFDQSYKSYRNHENVKSKNAKKLPLQLLGAIPKFLQLNGSSAEKQLFIVPEGTSMPKLIDQLRPLGIHALSFDDLSAESAGRFFTETGTGSPGLEGHDSSKPPQFLIATTALVSGLCFPGLRRIVCLGVDSVMDFKSLITVASRCRPQKSGLVREEDLVSSYFTKKKYTQQRELSKDGEEGQVCTVTLLYSGQHFKMMERFALERMILKSGLPYLEPMVEEYEDIDLKAYNKLFDDEGLEELSKTEY